MGEQEVDGIDVAMGHSKYVIGLLNQVGCEHPAPLLGNIDAQLVQGADGVQAGRLTFQGAADTGTHNVEIIASPCGVAKKTLGHGAAANISRANKQNGSHYCDKRL